jgi:hypothetical protein
MNIGGGTIHRALVALEPHGRAVESDLRFANPLVSEPAGFSAIDPP